MLVHIILTKVREQTYFVSCSTVIACQEYNSSHVDCLEI